MAAARAARVRVLLAFNVSRDLTRRHVVLSPARYRRMFLAFRARYPFVTEFITWNEGNHHSQPTARRPRLAARYHDVASRACPRCTILAADLLDDDTVPAWVKAFRRHARVEPRVWGLHNYIDANRFRTRGTRAMLRAVRGRIWFTETGGLVWRRGGTPLDESAPARGAGHALGVPAREPEPPDPARVLLPLDLPGAARPLGLGDHGPPRPPAPRLPRAAQPPPPRRRAVGGAPDRRAAARAARLSRAGAAATRTRPPATPPGPSAGVPVSDRGTASHVHGHARGAGATAEAGGVATPLNPTITRTMLTFFVIGDVLGAGIYALVGEVAAEVGGAIWSAFLLAGILAAFTATAYAELVTKYPQAAGAALYTHKAYKRPVPHLHGRLRRDVLRRLLRGHAGHRVRRRLPQRVRRAARAAGRRRLPLVLALINFRGIKESVSLNLGLTAIELTGLVLVMVIGAAFLLDGGGDPGRALEFTSGEAVPLAILSGASLAFFALIGFEDSVNVAEETKDPRRVFPKALFLGLIVALCIYLLVTTIASMAVPTDQLSDSDGPLLEVVQLGPLAMNTKVFSAIALFALTNGALINLIMASRLIYGMAQQGIVPRPMGRVHRARRTPWVAILFTTALAAFLVAVGNLEILADTTVTLLLLVFVSVNIAVLVLRRDPVEQEHWRAPTALPAIGAVVSLVLVVQKLADDPSLFAYAGGLLVARRGPVAREPGADGAGRGDRPRHAHGLSPRCSRSELAGQACLALRLERRVDRDRLDRAQRHRHGADLLGGLRRLLEGLLVDARHARAGDELDPLDGEALARLEELHAGLRLDRLGLVALRAENARQLHRVAAGVRGGDQLLGVRARALLEARGERVLALEGAGLHLHRAVAALQRAPPLRVRRPDRHVLLLGKG